MHTTNPDLCVPDPIFFKEYTFLLINISKVADYPNQAMAYIYVAFHMKRLYISLLIWNAGNKVHIYHGLQRTQHNHTHKKKHLFLTNKNKREHTKSFNFHQHSLASPAQQSLQMSIEAKLHLAHKCTKLHTT